jgi:hypothetical protein
MNQNMINTKKYVNKDNQYAEDVNQLLKDLCNDSANATKLWKMRIREAGWTRKKKERRKYGNKGKCVSIDTKETTRKTACISSVNRLL